jgi:predicted O-methyltransferase YrrM
MPGLDIGTYDGFTALNLVANIDYGGEVTTVDLPPDQPQELLRSLGFSNAIASENVVGSKYRGEPEATKIIQHWGNSAEIDWATLGGPFDMILIDGCHEYSFVQIDSANAIKHIRPGGTIFWHDYGLCIGVSRAIDELSSNYPICPIKGTRLACLNAGR